MRIALTIALALGLFAAPMSAEEIEVDVPQAVLQGTWLSPDTPQAAAVILPGSGPTDRDGNSSAGLRTDAYRLLAAALRDRGIATIRADKRGIGESTGDPNAVTLELYAQDAGRWLGLAKARSGLPCVWLIGHSEGGLLTLQMAANRDDICGLVLIAAPGRPVSQILLEQLRAVPGLQPHLPAAERAILALIAGQPVDVSELPAPLQGVFAPPIQPFLMNLFAVDPAEVAGGITLPALVVQGTADLQITERDASELADALPQATLYEVPGMTHVLKIAPGDTRAQNLATYSDPALPLAPGLVDRIAEFILAPR